MALDVARARRRRCSALGRRLVRVRRSGAAAASTPARAWPGAPANGSSTAARSSASQSPAMNASPNPISPSLPSRRKKSSWPVHAHDRRVGSARRRPTRAVGELAPASACSAPRGGTEHRAIAVCILRSGGSPTCCHGPRTSGAISRTERRGAVIVRRSAREGPPGGRPPADGRDGGRWVHGGATGGSPVAVSAR